MTDAGWEVGDLLGHDFPVHVDALQTGGPTFLTQAFRATGAMGANNRVSRITQLEPFVGGSTGCKAALSVTYERGDPGLPELLFVKFSRDLENDVRDRGKRQMESEVRFGLLSQIPDFPVAVPTCLFAEYNVESGSGVLISERIEFGADGVEPHHLKARDYEVPDLLEHYEALVAALARLAGSHRAGRFPADVMAHFEPGPSRAKSRRPAPITPDQVRERVADYAAFAARYPHLLPATIRSDAFLDELMREAPRSIEHADALRAATREGSRGLTAFCHWNANIDNAWFWRDDAGELACGLMDWGNVGQMNLVTALASCLTFAEPDFVIEHLDHLLGVFARAFEDTGGGHLDAGALRLAFARHVVAGGLLWPLGAVPLLERHVPDLAGVTDRFDPRIAEDEFPRTQLHLLTNFLMLWRHVDARRVIDDAIRRGTDGRRHD